MAHLLFDIERPHRPIHVHCTNMDVDSHIMLSMAPREGYAEADFDLDFRDLHALYWRVRNDFAGEDELERCPIPASPRADD